MEEKKKHMSKTWIYVDEIVNQVWKENWEQLTPAEEDLLKDFIEKKEIQEFKIVTLPAGMFCMSSASLENMYYIMSIVFMVIQSLEMYRRTQQQLPEKEIKKMIEDVIEQHSNEEQKRINQLILNKQNELISALKKIVDKLKKNVKKGGGKK